MTAPRLSTAAVSLSTAAVLLSTLFASPAAAGPDPAIDAHPAAPSSTSSAPPAAATGRFVVKFKSGTAGTASARGNAYGQAARAAGVSVKELRTTARGAAVVRTASALTAGESAKVLASLRSQSNVEYAEPDTFVRQASTPNDPLFPKQWDLSEDTGGMRVPAAWDMSSGQGVVVAVIDTGITAHSDLPNVLPGYDFISDSTMSNDGDGRDGDATDAGDYCNGSSSSWHGTHVAGTIGAAANNGIGIAGVAYSAKILPVRALGACGGYLSDIADAVVWASGGTVSGVPAATSRAKVINMSLGGAGQCGSYFQSALDFAAAQGVTVVAAAGNSNAPAAGSTPGNCNNIITVGATGREGSRSYYSNFGPEVDVSAPGGDGSTGGANTILSTLNDGSTTPGAETYGYMQGTSMAAPHVAGAAALIMSANPDLTPADVEAILKQTARPLPGSCDTGGCGAGLVDAAAAVRVAQPGWQPPATEPIVSGTPTIQGSARVGSVLTAVPGSWTPNASFSYQWYRAGTAIDAATASTYTVTAADLDQSLTVAVTGTMYGYDPATATSAPTPAVGPGTFTPTAPAITGVPTLGSIMGIRSNSTTWPAGTGLGWQWYRSGVPIDGATSSSYTAKVADVGHQLTISATGKKAGYTTLTVVSAPVTIAPGTVPDPVLTVTGSARVGMSLLGRLSEQTGWQYNGTRTWQWYRSGLPVPGTNHPYYDITAADLGKSIMGRVTRTQPGYATIVKETPHYVVIAGILSGPTPLINGTRKVGYTLTAASGTWTLGATLKYQWYRSGSAITGATASKYTLGAADRGKSMRVRVTGSKAGYTTLAKYSGSTSAIATGSLASSRPWMGGYARYGYTLTAHPGTWTAGTTLRYQWYRSGVPISGATGRYHRITWADRYDVMSLRVIGSKAGYTSLARYSGYSARVP